MAVRPGENTVARQVGRPGKPGGSGRPVRVDSDVVTMARRIADFQGVPLSDYLSGLLRPGVLRDYQAMLKKLSKQEEGAK